MYSLVVVDGGEGRMSRHAWSEAYLSTREDASLSFNTRKRSVSASNVRTAILRQNRLQASRPMHYLTWCTASVGPDLIQVRIASVAPPSPPPVTHNGRRTPQRKEGHPQDQR